MLARELALYVREYVPAFDWGSANCCHFAGRWVQRVTGRDPMAGLPATPSEREALRLKRALGGLRQAVTRQAGLPRIAAGFAQVGDLVLCGESLGICAGRTSLHVDEAGQLLSMDMERATCAWRLTCA